MGVRGYPWTSIDYALIQMHIYGYPWIYMDIPGYPWISSDIP